MRSRSRHPNELDWTSSHGVTVSAKYYTYGNAHGNGGTARESRHGSGLAAGYGGRKVRPNDKCFGYGAGSYARASL